MRATIARRLFAAGTVVIASTVQMAASGASAQEPPAGITDNETTTVVGGDAGSVPRTAGVGHGSAGGGGGHRCVDHDVRGAAYGREKKCNARPSSGGVARGDFNGDGYADLSIGVPLEDIGAVMDAGAVQVIYGGPSGLTANNQLWHEDVPGVAGTAEAGDQFGGALASGNFNGDAYNDLAIGSAFEDHGTIEDAGIVLVLLGSAGGLTTSGQYQLAQGTNGLQGTLEAGDRFGATLVWGHFNAGSHGDLAIGAPGEDVGAIEDAGATSVVYGSSAGLRASGGPGNQLWHQDVSGIASAAEDGDEFGASSTAGDFDGNGVSDLAVGVPNEGLIGPNGASYEHAGAVHVLYGSSNGLTAAGAEFLHDELNRGFFIPTHPGSPNASNEVGVQAHAHFGSALAAGDLQPDRRLFDDTDPVADGRADLAVGVPYGDVTFCVANPGFDPSCSDSVDEGWVFTYPGGAGGLDGNRLGLVTQDEPFAADEDSLFGWSVAIANLDGVGGKELVVGVPGLDREFGGPDDAGGIGDSLMPPDGYSRMAVIRSRSWCDGELCHSGAISLAGTDGDRLGESLAAWDIDGDSKADIAVGVPGDDFTVGTRFVRDAGVVHVLYGSGHQEHVYQGGPIGSTGGVLQGTAEDGDEFGATLY